MAGCIKFPKPSDVSVNGCSCHNPIWSYLEETLLTEQTSIVQKIFESARPSKVSPPLSVVYVGGTIRPIVGGGIQKVDAIGFHNGRVVACGTESQVLRQMNALEIQYKTVQLSGGQTLLPGMVEPHVHIVPTAMVMGWNDFGPFDGQNLKTGYNMDWLKGEIDSLVATGNIGDTNYWILGCGVDPSMMPVNHKFIGLNELQKLGVDKVDQLNSKIPLMMTSASIHTAYVNTTALRIIYESSTEIQAKYTFEKFKDHVNDNGGLQEMEMVAAFAAIPKKQIWKSLLCTKGNLDKLFQTANQRGVTLMYDAGMTPNSKALLDLYFRFEQAMIRIGYASICNSLKSALALDQFKPMTELKNLYTANIKLISDGSNQGLTGYQNESYRCEPAGNCGAFNFPPLSTPVVPSSEFTEIVKTIIDKDWPIMIHANGDKAIDITVAAYKDALNGKCGLEKRHRIEHCSILSDSNISEMACIGISPSFLIGHVGYWGYPFRKAIFEQKAEQLDRCKSVLDKGMRMTLHSDNSVSPLGPLRMMEQAMTRIMEGDPNQGVLNKNERITVEQALRAVTYDAAWQCHVDEWVGSLECGKMADYVILEEDPVTRSNPVGMRDIKVLETWIEGVRVYPA